MTASKPLETAQLSYSLLCDDIRLEAGNKLSLMGIFQNVYFQTLPSTILKFALLNHWVGAGEHTAEIRILAPDRNRVVLHTAPSIFSLNNGGFADNVTFFTNVFIADEGPHIIQIFLDQVMVRETILNIVLPPAPNATVN
ncbi:MAG: hypothetical protein U0V70_16850 [Terriglobia bacterium]